MSTEREFSAGGVVVRGEDCVVIVPVKRSPRGERVLALPKGHPDGNESAEEAATREVREETGVVAELVEPLGEVAYWYQRNSRSIHKRVRFFRFRYVSGSTDDHDDEIEQARWMPLAEAAEKLTYQGERETAARALSRVQADR
jgi:8-oxo-dGTP pyrophosphatase MutT (NUDIX family)